MAFTPNPNDYGPFCIFGNLYFVGTRDVGSHLIDTGEGLILLDTQYPQLFDNMVGKIEKLGFSLSDIKILLHSHGHVDHVGGTARLAAMTGARTYIGALDRDMAEGKVNTSFADELGFRFDGFFKPDVLLSDGDEIRLGNTVIRAVHSPGHTPGTMSYFLDITDGTDTYRAGMMGGSGHKSMEYAHLNKYGISDRWRRGFPDVIERLRKERVEVMMGNHNGDLKTAERYAEMVRTGKNTFIDPAAWGAHLDRVLARYYKMIEEDRKGE